MTDQPRDNNAANAWLIVSAGQDSSEFPYPQFAIELDGERKLYAAVAEGDWLVVGRRIRAT